MQDMNGDKILAGLLRWVEIDTQTGDTAGIARLIDLICAELAPLKPALERIPGRDGMGDHLIARFAGGAGPGVLISSHIDTVCPPGAVPIRREGDRQFGPGIADMKGGGYLALCALRNLVAAGPLPGPVTLIYNSDEEIGSPTSSALIQAEAARMGAALIPEPARGDEAITFRKGRAKYRLDVQGVESHAGSAFDKGHSAIIALAQAVTRIDALCDMGRGTTVNVGRIGGGTEPNVVAGHAHCDIDVRFSEDALALEVEAALQALAPARPQIRFALSGAIEKPCLSRSTGTLAMFGIARGFQPGLVETASGGGSDGNFTSAAGIATLDGIGAIGNDWHSPGEHILVSALARREVLLRRLIAHFSAHRP